MELLDLWSRRVQVLRVTHHHQLCSLCVYLLLLPSSPSLPIYLFFNVCFVWGMFTLLFTQEVLPYLFLQFKDVDKYCYGHRTVTISLDTFYNINSACMYLQDVNNK